jgi:hypothetical protein
MTGILIDNSAFFSGAVRSHLTQFDMRMTDDAVATLLMLVA